MGNQIKTNRELQKIQTLEKIMAVAFQLFAKQGLMATKTIDIAKAAGLSHGALFVHFPKREDLVSQVIQQFGEKVIRRIHELAGSGNGLEDVLVAHLQGLEEYEGFYTRVVMEGPLLAREVRQTLLGMQSALSHHLYEVAKIEIKKGAIKKIPMHMLFNSWIGLVHHYLINRDLFAPRQSVIKTKGPELIKQYMRMVEAR